MSENEPKVKETFSVLWVDDNLLISNSASLMVESIGHKCNTVKSGKNALEFLDNNSCDIIFTDIGMPEMNGWELIDAIRIKFEETIKIVAVTGWAIEKEVQDEYGISIVLKKPFTYEQLKQAFLDISLL